VAVLVVQSFSCCSSIGCYLFDKNRCCVCTMQSLVSKFRVSELQQLLTFAQRSKYGRKSELLERSLSLVGDGCPSSIAFKVHQLAR